METPHVNVMVATPGSMLTKDYVKSLLITFDYLGNNGISFTWLNDHTSHVADAREITLSGSLSNDLNMTKPLNGAITYDKVFWIDSDISWTPDNFMRLYESDKDIVSGAYMIPGGEVTAYPTPLGAPLTYEQVMNMSEPMKVHAVGFGFLAVKAGVFEALSRPWFQSAIFEYKDEVTGTTRDIPIIGEDISWCHRVNKLGYEVWLDPLAKVTHTKTVRLTWEGIAR